jgi:hypothetical protein
MRIGRVGAVGAIALAAVSSTADVAAAAPIVTIEHIEAASANDSSSKKAVHVTCPPDQVALGAWAIVDGAPGEVALKSLYPHEENLSGPNLPNTVLVVAAELAPYTALLWRVRVFATCADVPYGSVDRVEATSLSSSDSQNSATAVCGHGRVVVGAGGKVTPNGSGVILTGFYPDAGLTQVTAEAAESVPHGGNWTVTAYALCANPLIFDELTMVPGPIVPEGEFAWADCPATTLNIGGGAAVVAGDGRALLRSVAAYSAVIPRSVGVGADPRKHAPPEHRGSSPDWSLQSYAICAANVRV